MNRKIKAALMAMAATMLALTLCACGGETSSGSTEAASSAASNSAGAAGSTDQDSSDSSSAGTEMSSSASTSSSEANSSAAPAGSKTLVAYFSATGNTAELAKYAAEALDADIYEIVPEQPYTSDDLNYSDSGSRATTEQHDKSARPAISGNLPDMDGYDTVVLAYPIWWGEEPRIMDTFVESADLGGKNVVAFCTSGSSGIGSSDKNLAALASPDATWLEGTRFAAGVPAFDVEKWLGSIGLL